jgi:DNA polymerase
MTIELPSGRKLFYQQPIIGKNRFDKPSLMYMGMDQVKKTWGRVETYGGKLVENIVQAIARDILADSMLRLDKEGLELVMHVHDEVVAEVPEVNAEALLNKMYAIMGAEISWAKGLPLSADGYLTKYYKKD